MADTPDFEPVDTAKTSPTNKLELSKMSMEREMPPIGNLQVRLNERRNTYTAGTVTNEEKQPLV